MEKKRTSIEEKRMDLPRENLWRLQGGAGGKKSLQAPKEKSKIKQGADRKGRI